LTHAKASEKGNCPSGKHEIYCCGSRVSISEKGVKVLTAPSVEYCPLHEELYGTKKIDEEAVRESVEMKIGKSGFCCRKRAFDSEPVVAYGASEMMHVWLQKGFIDCAVVVCEGAGTVITANGELVQAIGTHLTGIIKTSPIQEIIEYVEHDGGLVLDKQTARIDQVAGAKKAVALGFKHVAVSVAGFQASVISELRNFETKAKKDFVIFSVCNTCVTDVDLRHIARADIACASASTILRTRIAPKSLLQLGVTIPVYALTQKGKNLMLAYLAEFNHKLVIFRSKKLPYQPSDRGPKLRKPNQKP
jgi:putative methanogenesis marker protein 8